ncbi:MAG: hypothetical protein WCF33_14785 [Pseudonocardiaceae bacterium]
MQTATEGGTFLRAAQQGMFAVDTAAGEKMVASIKQMQDRVNVQLRKLWYLKTEAKLGDLPEAHGIAGLDRLVAAGDEQSLEFVLQRFAETLQEAQQALEISMRNYAELEAQTKQDFRRVGHG